MVPSESLDVDPIDGGRDGLAGGCSTEVIAAWMLICRLGFSVSGIRGNGGCSAVAAAGVGGRDCGRRCLELLVVLLLLQLLIAATPFGVVCVTDCAMCCCCGRPDDTDANAEYDVDVTEDDVADDDDAVGTDSC